MLHVNYPLSASCVSLKRALRGAGILDPASLPIDRYRGFAEGCRVFRGSGFVADSIVRSTPARSNSLLAVLFGVSPHPVDTSVIGLV